MKWNECVLNHGKMKIIYIKQRYAYIIIEFHFPVVVVGVFSAAYNVRANEVIRRLFVWERDRKLCTHFQDQKYTILLFFTLI